MRKVLLLLFVLSLSFGQNFAQRTYAMIKPHAMVHREAIVDRILQEGLAIVTQKEFSMTEGLARQFYAHLSEKPFFGEILEMMLAGPVWAMILEGDNAIERWRELMGPTDPAKASEGTIRYEYGTDVGYNAVHGSDGVENAEKEIAFIFSET